MSLAKYIVLLLFFTCFGQPEGFFAGAYADTNALLMMEPDSEPEKEQAPLPQLVSNNYGDEEENHRATGPELVLPEFGSPVCIYPISLYLALGDRRERPPERL